MRSVVAAPVFRTRLTADTTGCSGAFSFSSPCGTSLSSTCFGRNLAVADLREQLVVLETEVVGGLRQSLAVEQLVQIDVVASCLLLEELAAELDRARLLLALNQVLDLAARARGRDEVQPVAARLVRRRW